MDEIGIKDTRLQRLMKAARNELNRVCSFYNELAERLGGDMIHIFT